MSRSPPPLPPRLDGQSQTSPVQRSTVSESSSYNISGYDELKGDEFRLLLLPNRTGPRLYTLRHFDLYAAPPYLALSYSWGKEDSNAELAIGNEKFKLPSKNLEIALEYLVDRYPGQYLWTDAICINQNNDEERASQIPRMKEIYTKTDKCVVWLGECPRGSRADRALPQLPGLLQRLQRYPPHLGFNEASFRQYDIPVPTSDEWEGLGDLMANEWFTRVWTFQESVLPKTLEILYGGHVISTDHIGQLAGTISAMPESGGLQFMADTVSNRTAQIRVGLRRVNTVATYRRQRSDLIPTQYTFLDFLANSTTWKVTHPCEYHKSLGSYIIFSVFIVPLAQWLLVLSQWQRFKHLGSRWTKNPVRIKVMSDTTSNYLTFQRYFDLTESSIITGFSCSLPAQRNLNSTLP
jgi:hypothetical protein